MFKYSSYWRNVVEELAQELNNVINILITLDEAKTLAPCQVSDDIKGKKLQPLAEVAAPAGAGEQFLRLVEPVGQRGVDERLVVDQRAHSESVVYTSTVFGVEVLISSRKQRQQRLAVRYSALDWVEIRLQRISIHIHTR